LIRTAPARPQSPMSDHHPIIATGYLVCSCGEQFHQRGRAKFRSFRHHISDQKRQALREERARRSAPWHEMVREVTADRLSILPCSLIVFAWACGVSREAARRWLQRHGAMPLTRYVGGRARVWWLGNEGDSQQPF